MKSDTAIEARECPVPVAPVASFLATRPFVVETVSFRSTLGAIAGVTDSVPWTVSCIAAAASAVAFAGRWIRDVGAATGSVSVRFGWRVVGVPRQPH